MLLFSAIVVIVVLIGVAVAGILTWTRARARSTKWIGVIIAIIAVLDLIYFLARTVIK